MAKLTNIKVKGAILLEPLVAMVIISAVLTLGAMVMGNMAKGNDSFVRFKALNMIESLSVNLEDLEDESFSEKHFDIDKEVSKYGQTEDVYQITWTVRVKGEKDIVLQQNQLICE